MRIVIVIACLLTTISGLSIAQSYSISNEVMLRNKSVSNLLQLRFCAIEAYSNEIKLKLQQQPKDQQPVASPNIIYEAAGRKPSENVIVNTDKNIEDTRSATTSYRELGISSVPKYYALLIGISDYKFSNEKLADLDNPLKDVNALNLTLQDYTFAKENIRILENATRSDIIDELDQLAQIITEKDNFLIFYAGHGFWDEHLRVGYWLPSDAQLHKKSTWLSNSNLKDYVAGIKARHTIVISDACFSGSIFKAREVADPLSDYGVSKLYRLPSRKAMTSGNLNITPDVSKFFEYLNKRLLSNESKYLSSRELFYSLYNAVINNTDTVPQYGVIQDTGDEGGEFIFIKRN
jgi:hypothetical protein